MYFLNRSEKIQRFLDGIRRATFNLFTQRN